MAQSEIIPRGIRNNNPLNIKLSPDRFQGELPLSYDDTFKQFRTMRDGLRAAFCIIRTYIIHKACNTLRSIVTRWCGETGKTLANYITVCEQRTGLLPDQPIRWIDKATVLALVAAMAFVECGRVMGSQLLSDAYDAA